MVKTSLCLRARHSSLDMTLLLSFVWPTLSLKQRICACNKKVFCMKRLSLFSSLLRSRYRKFKFQNHLSTLGIRKPDVSGFRMFRSILIVKWSGFRGMVEPDVKTSGLQMLLVFECSFFVSPL